MVLKPADPIAVAAHLTAWRNAVKKLPSQAIITRAEMIEHLQTMPPKDRVEEIKKLTGLRLDEEGRTVRRKLTRLFAELRLPPGRGRPKKPDK
jgi:hypothetical protein